MFLHTAMAKILFEDSFESGDTNKVNASTGAGWTTTNVGNSDSISVVNEKSHTGSYSLKFHFAGNSSLSDDAFSEARFTLGEAQTDVYIRFYVFFPSDYVHRDATGSDNNKFFDLWGNTYTKNTRLLQTWCYDKDDFVEQFVFAANGGTSLNCSGSVDNVQGERYYMPKSLLGRWVSFEIHNKMDNGTGNGEMELWVDGVQKISIKNMSWSNSPCGPGFFLDGYLLGWANSGFSKNTDIYIDDVVMSTTYIGTSSTPLTNTSSTADPEAPTNLEIVDVAK
jgi:hypothetical protein